MEFYNKHYIKVDSSGRVVDGWSDGPNPEKDPTDAVSINWIGGYQFRLIYIETDAQTGNPARKMSEENPPLFDWDGIPLYKWDGATVQPRTQEEIEADRAALPEPEPPAPFQDDVWAALDAAYREGVNSAYDQ